MLIAFGKKNPTTSARPRLGQLRNSTRKLPRRFPSQRRLAALFEKANPVQLLPSLFFSYITKTLL